jgi:signal transduction histidine kinase
MINIICTFYLFSFLFTKQTTNEKFDLSTIKFNEITSVELKNNCKFYWNRLIDKTDSNYTLVTKFSNLWNNLGRISSEVKNLGYGSYLFTLVSDSARNDLAFEIPGIYSSYKFFFNQVEVASSGTVSKSEEGAKPFWLPQLARLKIKKGTNEIIFHVSNYNHNKGGPSAHLQIGSYEKLLNKQKFQIALDLFLFGILIITGLFIFGFYLFGQKKIHLIYFSLYCISYSYRQIGYGDSYLHSAFQSLPWAITLRLEYISLCLTVFFFALYVYYLYREDVHKIVLDFLRMISLIYIALILLTPDTFFTKFVNYYLVCSFMFISYGIYVFTKAFIKKRSGAKYGLMSIFFVFTSFYLLIFESFFHASVNSFLVFIGLSGFILCQVLILSHGFALFYKQALYDANSGLRAKSLFLATISHEIRNPLAAILGSSEILEKTKLATDQSTFVRIIKKSSQNLNVIISDILSLTKLEYSQVQFNNENLDLVKVIEDVLEIHYTNMDDIKDKINFSNTYSSETYHQIIADNTRIKQILNNLIFNAIKFTREGTISIHLKTVSSSDENCKLEFQIKDTGIGIPEDKLKSLFEQFSQVDSENKHGYGGLGLGLYICKVLVSKYNGEIWVESDKGKGSTFYFTINCPKIDGAGSLRSNFMFNSKIECYYYKLMPYQEESIKNFAEVLILENINEISDKKELFNFHINHQTVLICNEQILEELTYSELLGLDKIKILLIVKSIQKVNDDIKNIPQIRIISEPIKLSDMYKHISLFFTND